MPKERTRSYTLSARTALVAALGAITIKDASPEEMQEISKLHSMLKPEPRTRAKRSSESKKEEKGEKKKFSVAKRPAAGETPVKAEETPVKAETKAAEEDF